MIAPCFIAFTAINKNHAFHIGRYHKNNYIGLHKSQNIMGKENQLQVDFLRSLEQSLPQNISLVHELEDLLGVSIDSAYRRLRGETALSFGETAKICSHFNVSFDAFHKTGSSNVMFTYNPFYPEQESFKDYFKSILRDLKPLAAADPAYTTMLYAAKSAPIFHYFDFDNLAAFKIFYWMRTIMNISNLQTEKFTIDLIESEILEVAREMHKHYHQIPSREIWTDTTVMGTLLQINFYWNSGAFSSKEDALNVCEEYMLMLDQVKECAETGTKRYSSKSYELYFSEVEFENNCIYVQVADNQAAYLGHLSFWSITSRDPAYCQETAGWLNNIRAKSNLISGVSETTRYQFFRRSREKIEELIKEIKS